MGTGRESEPDLMEAVSQNRVEQPTSHGWVVPAGPVLGRRICGLIVLFLVVIVAPCLLAQDSDSDGSNQPSPTPAVLPVRALVSAQQQAADSKLSDQEKALKKRLQDLAQGPPPIPPPPPRMNRVAVVVMGFLIVAALAFPTAVTLLDRRRKAALKAPTKVRQPFENLFAEEPTLGAFFEALRAGPSIQAYSTAGGDLARSNRSEEAVDDARPEATPLQTFFDSIPVQVSTLRSLFAEVSRSKDVADRQAVLSQLSEQLYPFKESCALPGLRFLWQLASSLQALVHELARKESNVTASALKTVAGGLDLIEALRVGEVEANLEDDIPAKLLAVDDDAVSLRALSFALQKAFDAPDTAPDGERGLALVAGQAYDVIFLDVEMPGLDGFEVCTKIRKTPLNHATPVVFVTRHSDFNSRARTALCGGNDLIGKPFLALEITVKALTLVFRSRHRGIAASLEAISTRSEPAEVIRSDNPSQSTDEAVSSDNGLSVSRFANEQAKEPSRPAAAEMPLQVGNGPAFEAQTPVPLPGGQFDGKTVHFEELRSQVRAAMVAQDEGARKELLGQLFVGIHELALQTERDGQISAHRLCAALEDLMRKLLERPVLCNTFVLDAAADALGLLSELHSSGADLDFVTGSFRILVVDDDPIARRAVSGSLQLVFGKPESAESGEAALELADKMPFDLILLDVLMPGMDGFETCLKIHQAELNRETPVLFVTSCNDGESRRQAAAAGGCGFITKPVLPKEIMLRTLTLTLRRRLRAVKRDGVPAEVTC